MRNSAVESTTDNGVVVGSNPAASTNLKWAPMFLGRRVGLQIRLCAVQIRGGSPIEKALIIQGISFWRQIWKTG